MFMGNELLTYVLTKKSVVKVKYWTLTSWV